MLSVSLFFFGISVVGAVYLATAARALAKFIRRPCPLATEFLPSVAVLKPVAGLEPELYENLASFCNQDYGGLYEPDLLSGVTRDLAHSDLPAGASLLDLGSHRLKDLAEAEHVWQLTIAGFPR